MQDPLGVPLLGRAPAATPSPPYTAVIFTSLRTAIDDGYAAMSEDMVELASRQPGFLGVESARDELGITVSYWETPEAARAWKTVAEHRVAQKLGRQKWYRAYRVRVATVEREYGHPHAAGGGSEPAIASKEDVP